MLRKTLVWTVLVVGCLAGVAAADSSCQDKYTAGRAALLEGSLSGVRAAYTDFNEAMQDQACASDNNLIFLHAVSRTAMLAIDNSDLSLAHSIIDIANAFGVTVVGDYFTELKLNVSSMQGNCYKIPSGAPDATEVSQMIQTSIIPEINSIIVELGTISDSPAFQISFSPAETGLDKTIKVDYGEVLILKGILAVLKSQLEFRQAYNLAININDPKVKKLIDEAFCHEDLTVKFNINRDFINRYANLLKVLPGGGAVLTQSKQDLIEGISYYFTVINYIESEPGPQEDHLIYIDPADQPQIDWFGDRLQTLLDSLQNDTTGIYPLETTKTYNVYQGAGLAGNLVLVYNLVENCCNGGNKGTLTLSIDGVPAMWKITNFDGAGADFGIDLEYYSSSEQRWGWFDGTLSSDGNEITNGTFSYSGYWSGSWQPDGSVSDISAEFVSEQTTDVNVDLNPVFGGSGRYPTPVNPRDLLPKFDAGNELIPGTFGSGLNNDATFGGILPDMNQGNWSKLSLAMPKIVGKLADDANKAIVGAGLVVGTVTGEYSNKIAVDTVITQSPTAGKKVASGSTVNYVKSLGKPIVPNVVGMIPADASTAITSVDNLKVGKVTSSYSDTVAEGVIISQSPAAGTMVSVGSKVKYIISLGRPIVPNVVGKSAAKANAAIKSVDNLKVGPITTAHSDTVAAGVVISQSPDAGTEVATGSQVSYVKSLGKPVVPKIVGKLADDANTAIVNAGLVVGDITTAYSNKVAAGKIISQNPAAGKKVTIGSAVNYVRSLGKQL